MERGCSSFLFHMMRMVMKMAAVSAISLLLLLCCSSISSTDSQEVCDRHAAKGDNFTLPLLTTVGASESLRWIYNDLVILHRRGSIFIRGKQEDISENGSLKLVNVSTSKAGTYKSQVHDTGGNLKGEQKIIRLCVLDRVLVPSLLIICLPTSVKFTCKVAQQDKDVNYEWRQNDKVLKEKVPTLIRVTKDVETDSFSCKVSNAVSAMSSSPATQNCLKPSSVFPDKLFGINTWIIVGAGGGVVLVLIITVIVCCICTKRRKQMQLKDEGELRLAWTNNQDQHQHDRPPEHHHHHHPPEHQHHHHPPDQRRQQHHRQQQPAGHTGPRQQRSKQHQRDQQRPRVPELPAGHPQPSPRRPAQVPRLVDQMGEEQPPPLPQPRKKAGKAPRV